MSRILLFTVLQSSFIFILIQANCPNNCNQRGKCDKYSKCNCADGYEGGDCSLRSCPQGYAWSDQATGIDQAHNLAICSNRGKCDYTLGVCNCLQGFTGAACERLDCDNSCSNNGKCLSMKDFASKTRNVNSQSFTYDNVWDANKIYGCKCGSNYYDYQCSEMNCPHGDDPLTIGQVNDIQLVQCNAVGGSFLLYYNGYPSKWIPYTATAAMVKSALLTIPFITDINVIFSQRNSPVCNVLPNIIQIEFTQQFGPLPPLVPLLDSSMTATNGRVQVSADGKTTFADFITQVIYRSQLGTKEYDTCSNRGICTGTGLCACYNTNGDAYGSSDGYGHAGSRGDCGYIQSGLNVSTCPGDIQCNDNGVCDTTSFRCTCAQQWNSGDCSQRLCPTGLSWFDYPVANNEAHESYAPCSNMGVCDTVTGTCTCRINFFGEACQYMASDGGGGGSSGNSYCSGNGRSLPMSELAWRATHNGDAADYTYGADPNNPYTWDANRIYGCICEEGYEGYDCSLQSCPSGDDPGTYDDHSEVQLLQCTANEGTFTLKFRQQVTTPINANATADIVEAALSQLSTIQFIKVYFSQDGPPPEGTLNYAKPILSAPEGKPSWLQLDSNGNYIIVPENVTSPVIPTAVCDVNSNQVIILHYIATPSDLPSITADTSQLIDTFNTVGLPGSGTIAIYTDGASVLGLTSIKGTTENAICNNRGLCNRGTGVCECFEGWSSSNGAGQPGDRGDCGYRHLPKT